MHKLLQLQCNILSFQIFPPYFSNVYTHSNCTLNVSLWGERALAFEAEAIHKAGQGEPQIVLFVGTLVKDYTQSGIGI